VDKKIVKQLLAKALLVHL